MQQLTRPLCELLRTLAHGDSSVALVCAMHPTVLSFWLTNPQVPDPFQAAWESQRRHIFQTVCERGPGGAPSRQSLGVEVMSQNPDDRTSWSNGRGLPADRPEGVRERIGDHLLHADHRHA
jgi:hypothetical protein